MSRSSKRWRRRSEGARERGYVDGALTPGDLLRFPQALSIRRARRSRRVPADGARRPDGGARCPTRSTIWKRCGLREGGYLARTSTRGVRLLGELFERAARRLRSSEAGLQARLEERVRELRADALADESLIAQEIAKFVGRSDITEEVVRFRGHLEHWRALTDSPSRAAANWISCCRK